MLKETLLHGCFLRFLNCANGTKLRKTSRMLRYRSKFHLIKLVKQFGIRFLTVFLLLLSTSKSMKTICGTFRVILRNYFSALECAVLVGICFVSTAITLKCHPFATLDVLDHL